VQQAFAKAKPTAPGFESAQPLFEHKDPRTAWNIQAPQAQPFPSQHHAVLVGQLPGQSELPLAHFEEAAISHNPVDEGTLEYVSYAPADNLWQRVRDGYALPHILHPRITSELNWYKKHQNYLNRVSDRSERYLHLIIEEVERRGMPSEIALLPIVESAFIPFAYSHGRAAGIWQFIPSTGRIYGLKQNWWYDGRRDIAESTRAALDFLQHLNKRFDGDWMLALAAYNSGQGTVSRAMRKNKRKGKPTDFWSLDLPKETRAYVPKLIAISTLIENPAKYGVTLPSIPNEPFMVAVDIKKQIDLTLAAELADISLDELYMLNPGYNRWATDPEGPHRLMVPVEKAEYFEDNLAKLSDSKRVAWERHTIRKGESLLSIADKYNTTVALIKELNDIRGNMIRIKQKLIIPVARKSLNTYSLSADQRLTRLQNTKRSGKHKITYEVRKGDTLWNIARKYKVGVRTLAKWNGLAPRDTLRQGKKLVVWTKRGATIAASNAKFTPRDRTQKINYRVRRGDSLARISQKFKVNLYDLIRWNDVSPKKHLQPGQKLVVYVDVTRQAGNI
jgi:membrane-bound lytic murein transglycosylase D